MFSSERPVVRLFVGKGDFHAMRDLEQKREDAGWYMARVADVSDRKYALARSLFKDSIVVVNGSCPGACVAFSIIEALEEGAWMVRAPITNMMTEDEGAAPILKRARELVCAVPEQFLGDPRLVVSPIGLVSSLRREVLQHPEWETGYRTFDKYKTNVLPVHRRSESRPIFPRFSLA